jgi:hypothetical protein
LVLPVEHRHPTATVVTDVLEEGVTEPKCTVEVEGVSRKAVLIADASRAALRKLIAHVAGGDTLGRELDAFVREDFGALVVRDRMMVHGHYIPMGVVEIPLEVRAGCARVGGWHAWAHSPASLCVCSNRYDGWRSDGAPCVDAGSAVSDRTLGCGWRVARQACCSRVRTDAWTVPVRA